MSKKTIGMLTLISCSLLFLFCEAAFPEMCLVGLFSLEDGREIVQEWDPIPSITYEHVGRPAVVYFGSMKYEIINHDEYWGYDEQANF